MGLFHCGLVDRQAFPCLAKARVTMPILFGRFSVVSAP
jgi:hypothetical protein